jgi:hypothetical protein
MFHCTSARGVIDHGSGYDRRACRGHASHRRCDGCATARAGRGRDMGRRRETWSTRGLALRPARVVPQARDVGACHFATR